MHHLVLGTTLIVLLRALAHQPKRILPWSEYIKVEGEDEDEDHPYRGALTIGNNCNTCCRKRCRCVCGPPGRVWVPGIWRIGPFSQVRSVIRKLIVTCGGVRLSEVNFKTMGSRICPGLYFAGELLDIDGITGGFNFQAAWTTGFIAGHAMAA